MKIWIDLDHTPHVPVFRPLLKELEKRGIEVVITARDFAQTILDGFLTLLWTGRMRFPTLCGGIGGGYLCRH